MRSLDGGTELWAAAVDVFQGAGQFVLRYEVAGQTFYDNNNGYDYYISDGAVRGAAIDVSVAPAVSVCAACDPGFDLGGSLLPLSG